MYAITRSTESPEFTVPGFKFTGFTAPSRGSKEISSWKMEAEPGARSMVHQLNHEETFIVLDGNLTFTVEEQKFTLTRGDALSVHPHARLMVENDRHDSAMAIVCMPSNTTAATESGEQIGTPPWAR